ncbi:MAG: D-aminoacyl-tRNA deacylase, partial [Bacteroidales bacterium]
MRLVIQRVRKAKVDVSDETIAEINKGMLILVGIEDRDTEKDIEWAAKKIVNLRIFDDTYGIMTCSIKEIDGDIILVSQFTLHASTKKGNRPAYIKAARPEIAIPIYEKLRTGIESNLERNIQTGKFGADMQVELINDGPVTIL